MKIMVFDVPATTGGALTILRLYYNKALLDSSNKWIFVVSTPTLEETDHIRVMRFPWVKKSWLHRLFFDQFIAPRIVRKVKPDEILSLQNVAINHVKTPQTLYLHQPLPFVEKRYSFHENYKFWIIQNVISKMIIKSIKKVDKVIVQTNWIKEACLKKINVAPEKFDIIQPQISIQIDKKYQHDGNNVFFYPAGDFLYKNHEIIVKATEELIRKGFTNFNIVFTLFGNEADHIKKIYNIVKSKQLPITFIGSVNIEQVYDYYGKSVLIFPSYVETFGLPMLEAKMHETPIIASDCAFSHEILDDYDKVDFFNPFDSEELAKIMKKYIS